MTHDVFISYSSKDKPIADAVCGALEDRRIRCWIAPRDVLPGLPYPEAIIEAIEASRLMVLVFSSNANDSPQVMRKVERAVSKRVPIIPFRIEQVLPSKSLEYFLSSPHRLDALTPPVEKHFPLLVKAVELLLLRQNKSTSTAELKNRLGEAIETPQPHDPVSRRLITREFVRFAFVGMGEQAPEWTAPQDRLWLDVGNDLRPASSITTI